MLSSSMLVRFFAPLLGIGVLVGCHRPQQQAQEPPKTPIPSQKQESSPLPPNSITALTNYTPVAKEFERLRKPAKQVALTFDAGSDDKGLEGILAQLKKHNTHATFFLTGKFCEKFPEATKRIVEAGMEIGNHSYSHPQFPKLEREAILEQLSKTDAIIEKISGRSTKPLFRFPYGASDKRTRALVTEAGYQAIYWSVDSLDSIKPKKTAEFLAERVIERLQDGGVCLMHVSTEEAASALETIFDHLEKQGIQAVPVSELLLLDKAAKEKETKERLAKQEANRQLAEEKNQKASSKQPTR